MRKTDKSKRISGTVKIETVREWIKRKKRGRCYDTEYQKTDKVVAW